MPGRRQPKLRFQARGRQNIFWFLDRGWVRNDEIPAAESAGFAPVRWRNLL